MADRWIITDRKFMKHNTYKAACAEHFRLSQKFSGRVFDILRIKSHVQQGNSFRHMRYALNLAKKALEDKSVDRATALKKVTEALEMIGG